MKSFLGRRICQHRTFFLTQWEHNINFILLALVPQWRNRDFLTMPTREIPIIANMEVGLTLVVWIYFKNDENIFVFSIISKLEQLERLRSEDTPHRLMITHTIESYWIPSQKKTKSKLQIWRIRQNFKFWNKHYMRHTFWSCLIRCANMKWIRWVLLKIQSEHHSVHRWTDGQNETSIPPFQLRWSGGYN